MNRGVYGISNENPDVVVGSGQTRPAVSNGSIFIGEGAGGQNSIPADRNGLVSTTFLVGGNITGDPVGIVAIGYQAYAGTANSNASVAIGWQAGFGGGSQLVAIGYQAGRGGGFGGIAIGYGAGNSGMINSVIIGNGAMPSPGAYSTALGTTAGGGVVNATAVNTFIGGYSGYGATGPGTNKVTTGTGNTFVGYDTAPTSSSQISYATAIGHGVHVGASGAVAIGVDHTGAAATTTTQDQFMLGTANHAVLIPGTLTVGSSLLTFPSTSDTVLGALGAEPLLNGYKSWTFDPTVITPTTFTPVKGTIYYTAVLVRAGFVLANIDFYISSAGAMGASTPTFYLGVYNAAGTQLAVSANVQATVGANTGQITAPVSYTFTAAGVYYIGYLPGNTITTSPTIYNVASIASAFGNINRANGSGTLAARASTGATAQTTLPSPVSGTPTAVVNALWFGLR